MTSSKNTHRKMLFIVAAITLILLTATSHADQVPSDPRISIDPRTIPVTRWVSPGDERPLSYSEWRMDHPATSFSIQGQRKVQRSDSTEVLILVNTALQDTLTVPLAQYIADLELEGYVVETLGVSGGTAADLKALMQSRPSLLGAILIGDVPIPWFQMIDDFEGDGVPDGYEEFPIDLFYMDLDGTWQDLYYYDSISQELLPGPDGILDSHGGDQSPEIWIGRLTASPMTEDEIALLENYLDKAHRYRQGSLWLRERALNYIDDDWSGSWTTAGLESIYGEVVVVDHPESTVAADYEAELTAEYEWIGVCAHSWPGGHGFIYNGGSTWSYFYAYQLDPIDPQGLFYNLFACSNARYVEANYMGGCYIFTDTYGLGAVGSTKTGSMLYFEQFYYPLGGGVSLGQAFKEWFDVIASGGFATWEHSWFYGMTLLGDPTLVPRQPDRAPPGAVADLQATLAGEAARLEWTAVTEDLYGRSETVSYYVIYRDTSSSFVPQPGDSIGISIAVAYLDSLPESKTDRAGRYYLVVAVDSAGNRSVPSNETGQFDRLMYVE
jgi:hypothetical protein